MQQEDEYRLHMELNRCLKKDTAATEADPDLFESQTTRTVSSRGLFENSLFLLLFGSASCFGCTALGVRCTKTFLYGFSLEML